MYLLHKPSSQFPFTSHHTYLNTPAYGLLSEPLMEWRQEHDLDHLVGGGRFKEKFFRVIEELRATLAQYVHASREEVFLVPNFSFGWKVLISGLPKDRHVLLLDGDYPSLNWPVLTSGFKKLGTVKVSPHMEQEIERYFEQHAPQVFTFSIVQYLSGLKLSGTFIRDLKRRYPETLFMADATQYLGTEVFDFAASGIDVLGASGYKWLLAGTGNGFFLVREQVQESFYEGSKFLEPRKEPWLQHNSHLQNHLEPGHLDSMSMGSLHQAVTLLLNTGPEKIQSRVEEIRTYAAAKFYEYGFISDAVFSRSEHGSFYALQADEKQLEALRQRHVHFAIRGGNLRVGFHFYNRPEEVDALVKIMNHTKSR